MLAIFLVIGGAFLRLAPHLPNFTPIGAMALFSGAKIEKRYALGLTLLAMALSDYLLLYINPYQSPMINFSKFYQPQELFHATTIYVWTSVLISGLVGIMIKKTQKRRFIIGASLLCSIQFYLITNFGVWASGYYQPGLNGLLQSYMIGIPFFKWTMLGDLFYTGLFFSVYSYVTKFSHELKMTK